MIIYSIPNHLECQLVSSYKMIKMCLSFLIINILISFRVEAKSSCNDECLTKTYCISSDGSGVCSNNNLVTAQFSVIPVFGNYDFIQLTLKGYNVTSNDEKTIKVSFDKSGSPSNVYTCYKSSNRSTTAIFDRGTFSATTGSSHYMEGVLPCTWTFNIYYTIWPLDVDLIKYSSQSITLYHDSKKVVVAQDTSQLPIYHVQYLKCCNRVHANDVFLLTFDQTEKQIRYRLYYWKYDSNKKVTVTLTRKDGVKLQFECNLYSDLDGYISNGTERFSVDQQLIERNVDYHRICSWATPFVLGNSGISIDASTSVFDLQVEDDRGPVYIEQDVALKNSSHLLKLNLIFIAFAILNSIDLLIN